MEYTVEYFIEKFEGIPESLWCVDIQQDNNGRRCAYGHCMPIEELSRGWMSQGYGDETKEGKALKRIIADFLGKTSNNQYWSDDWSPAEINNGEHPRFQQPTPKQRILAALYEIRDKQQPIKTDLPIPTPEPKKQGRQYTTVVIDRGIIELKNIDSLKPVLN